MAREDIMAREEIPVVEILVVEIAQNYHRGPKRS